MKKLKKNEINIPKFNYTISNPPYQNTKNRPVFQHFQNLGSCVAENSIMIYMASRWWYGTTGLPEFRKNLLTDTKLYKVCYFHEREVNRNVFPGTLISGGLTIVQMSDKENLNGFILQENLTNHSTMIPHDEKLMPIKSSYAAIAKKILLRMEELHISPLFNRSEKGFVSEIGLSAEQVKILNPIPLQQAKELLTNYEFNNALKLYANISGERTGKSAYYVIDRNQKVLNNNKYKKNKIQEDKYKICMGQSIIENENRSIRLFKFDKHTTYGRAAVSLAYFDNETEAENYYKYASTKFFEFCLRLSIAGRLKTFGLFVPDFNNYIDGGSIDWSSLSVKELNNQLYNLFNIQEDEIKMFEKNHLINLIKSE